jgi:D-alanyl-lipoteichoic acid acyltransferase DltB (MBOAT superfamily)
MLFNSLEFAVFFPIVCALYFGLPYHARTPLLLVASCVFYMAFIPSYILILAITIFIDFFAGIYLVRTVGRTRKVLLWTSIIATCMVLVVFKYFDFFTDSIVGVATLFGWEVTNPSQNIILPIGLSFHTFQSLSYVIEVYRGKQKPIHDLTTYAAYVMFFPQLVAGPIERPQNLLHQFAEKHDFDYDRVTSGLKRMAWGFFKKLVVADRLALYVNDVYASPENYNGLQLSIATVFFAYQIYCDFSGYSDIAIGSARVLGFRLMENFDNPYHSKTIPEFWRRWHISLSTWFRDYVYYPMGGNRVAKPRWYLNLMVTFGISGLWHGSNWTFVIWGLLNGVYLVLSAATGKARDHVMGWMGFPAGSFQRNALQIGITFFLVCVGWVFFRANSLSDATYILTHFWQGWDFRDIRTEQFLLRQFPVAVAGIAVLELAQVIHARYPVPPVVARWPMALRWSGYAAMMLAVVLFGVYRKGQFIYFQF